MTVARIACVVGARPNFMKMAPILEALARFPGDFQTRLIHTGQHYDERLSSLLFGQLGLPEPDVFLGVGSDSQARQTAKVMMAFEDDCGKTEPDLALVVGDVNSTLACALVAAKLQIPLAHVEAGLRSWDRTMPEEINRIVTDSLSDLLFTTSREAGDNLRREGIPADKIHFVGNVMIDSLRKFLPKAQPPAFWNRLGLEENFGLVTLHRPSNVDRPEVFAPLVETLLEISQDLPLLFPCHPRTLDRYLRAGYSDLVISEDCPQPIGSSRLFLVPPQGYLEFLFLLDRAKLVLTDSGGIQEEAVVLGTPCLTLRDNTERPVTLEGGANRLVGNDPNRIRAGFEEFLRAGKQTPHIPEKWEGGSAHEIAHILKDWWIRRDR
jgi:UDP-N-acetylglucosamine 2-epimerase (non-hydrolysing)